MKASEPVDFCDEVDLTTRRGRKLESKVHNEDNEVAELSYYANFCLADMKETSKCIKEIRGLVEQVAAIEKPEAQTLKSVKLEPQLLIPDDEKEEKEESQSKTNYKRLICYASENIACLERDDVK